MIKTRLKFIDFYTNVYYTRDNKSGVGILDLKKELEKLELLNAEAAEVIKKNLSMFTFINIRTADDLYIYTEAFFHVAAKYPYQIRQTANHPDGLCLL